MIQVHGANTPFRIKHRDEASAWLEANEHTTLQDCLTAAHDIADILMCLMWAHVSGNKGLSEQYARVVGDVALDLVNLATAVDAGAALSVFSNPFEKETT